jgi:hypothetical protein
MNADPSVQETGRDYVSLLRLVTGSLTLVTAASLFAVGAFAPAGASVVIGGAVTIALRPGRRVPPVLAGVIGLAMVILSGNYLASAGTPDEWGDQLFVYAGGILAIATVVIAGMTIAGNRKE